MASAPPTTGCSNCGGQHTSIRAILICYHGEAIGGEAADRAAARLRHDLDHGLAETMARSITGILAIRNLIAGAPPEERPALVAHVKREIERRVQAD